jgi:hypothetical protein
MPSELNVADMKVDFNNAESSYTRAPYSEQSPQYQD